MVNDKSQMKYWDRRGNTSKNEMELVYASQGFQRSTEIGEQLIVTFVREGMRVLDVGCGYGRFYPAFKKAGANYTGIDFSREMLKHAEEKYPDGHFVWGDWHKFEGYYDVVFESICLSSFNPHEESESKETHDEFIKLLLWRCTPDGIVISIEPCDIRVVSNENIFL